MYRIQFLVLGLLWGGGILGIEGCAGDCQPRCLRGYTCVGQQCEYDPNQGREHFVNCSLYCEQLAKCMSTSASSCERSCSSVGPDASEKERNYWLRLYECYMGATCDEIKAYLAAKPGNRLNHCIGCLAHTRCPGGFTCDLEASRCRTACITPDHCQQDPRHICFEGVCKVTP